MCHWFQQLRQILYLPPTPPIALSAYLIKIATIFITKSGPPSSDSSRVIAPSYLTMFFTHSVIASIFSHNPQSVGYCSVWDTGNLAYPKLIYKSLRIPRGLQNRFHRIACDAGVATDGCCRLASSLPAARITTTDLALRASETRGQGWQPSNR